MTCVSFRRGGEVGHRVGALQLVVLDAALPGRRPRRRVTLASLHPNSNPNPKTCTARV